MGANSLTGTLPAAIGGLTELRYLNFGIEPLVPSYLADLGLSEGSNQMTGTFPASWVNLNKLEVFSLKRAGEFSGELPDLSSWTSLQRLYLQACGFSGELPGWISTLPALSFVQLDSNGFTTFPESLASSNIATLSLGINPLNLGPFPMWVTQWTSIIELHLAYVGLTGTLPSEVGNLVNLVSFGVVGNQLEGTIPGEIFSSAPGLSGLFLHQNRWVGDIPDAIGSAAGMVVLSLSETPTLTGTIPASIGTMSAGIGFFNAAFNQTIGVLMYFNENGLTGTIPDTIGNIAALSAFRVESNNLEGTLPPSVASLSMVSEMWLNDNNLEGPFPTGGLESVLDLRINDNHFNGTLEFLCTMPGLTSLSAARNRFSEVGSCVSGSSNPVLEAIDLSENMYSGSFPSEIATITTLKRLDLSGNAFSALRLPAAYSGLTTLRSISLARNNLQGNAPEYFLPLRELPDLVELDFSGNQLKGELRANIFAAIRPEPRTFFNSLVFMRLSDNNLTSTIPKFVGEMASLFEFSAANNDFEGTVPASFVTVGITDVRGNPQLIHSPDLPIPSWLYVDYPFVQAQGESFSCPTYRVLGRTGVVSVDPAYFSGRHCKCLPGTAGLNASCIDCSSLDNIICRGGEVDIEPPTSTRASATGAAANVVSVQNANLTISPGWFPLSYSPAGFPILERCYQIKLDQTACNPDAQDPFQCQEGYEDRLCSKCSKEYYSKSRRCEECISVLPIFIAVVYGLLFLSWYLYTISVSMPGFYAPTIKSLFIFLQTSVVLVTETTVLAWPSNVTALFDGGLSWATFSIGMLHCLTGGGSAYTTNFILQVAFVPCIVGFTAAMYAIIQVVSSLSGGHLFSLSQWEWQTGAIRVVLAVLNLGYLPIAVGVLSSLFCAAPDELGKSYLFAAPWIQCTFSSSTYTRLFVVGFVGTIVYAVGIPLLFLFLLLWFRSPKTRVAGPEERAGVLPKDHILLSRHGTPTDDWLGFLYYSYTQDKFWFELAILVRRLLIALLAVIPSDNTPLPLYALLLTLIGALVAQIYIKPFRNDKINTLEALALTQLLITFVCGLIFSSKTFVNSKGSVLPLEILLIASNVGVIALFVYALVWFMNRSCNSSSIMPDDDEDVQREMISARSHYSRRSSLGYGGSVSGEGRRSRAPVADVVGGTLVPPGAGGGRSRPHPAVLPPLRTTTSSGTINNNNSSDDHEMDELLEGTVPDEVRNAARSRQRHVPPVPAASNNKRSPSSRGGRPPAPKAKRPVISNVAPRTMSGSMLRRNSSSFSSRRSSSLSSADDVPRPRASPSRRRRMSRGSSSGSGRR